MMRVAMGVAALAVAAPDVAVVQSAAVAPDAAAAPDTLLLSGTVQPAIVRIGEPVTVRLVVPVTEEHAEILGPKAPASAGTVDLLVSQAVPAGPDSTAWELVLAFFESGEQTLPPVDLTLRGAAGESPARLAPYAISVLSVIPDTVGQADIRDIQGPVPVAWRWMWWRIAAAALLLAAVIAGILWWRRRRPAVVPVPRPEITIDPETEALLALRALEDEALAARGQLKEHYARLSLILRAYLERRLRIPAVESTTEEIQRDLLRRPALPPAEARAVLALMEEADLVKFARQERGPDAAREALVCSRAWVERVGPTLAPPPVAEPGAA